MKAVAVFVIAVALLAGIASAQTEVCQICNLVVTEAESYLSGGSITAAEVEAVILAECSHLPNATTTYCQGIVQDYLDPIIAEIFNGTAADQVCHQIELCNATAPDWECDGCQAGIFIAEEWFKHNGSTYDDIMYDLKELCLQLPKDVQLECNLAVDITAPAVIKAMLAMDPPKQICQSVKLCPAGAGIKTPRRDRLHPMIKQALLPAFIGTPDLSLDRCSLCREFNTVCKNNAVCSAIYPKMCTGC